MEQLNVDKFTKLRDSCRLCLSVEQEISLFAVRKSNQQEYYKIVEILTNIVINDTDQLPQMICQECASKLILFEKFKKRCETSNNTLNTLLESKLIEENKLNEIKSPPPKEERVEVEVELPSLIAIEILPPPLISITSKVPPQPHPRPPHSKKRKHQCEECGQIFGQKSSLIQHNSTHTGIKNFQCSLCSTKFTRKSHLLIHMRSHDNIRPYSCKICNRSFVRSGDLLRHNRIHSDEKNYECLQCDKRFKRSTDLSSHMRTHTGEKPYKCKNCDKCYTSHSSLKKHLKHHIIISS